MAKNTVIKDILRKKNCKISNKINCENSQLKLLKIQTRDYLELLKKKAVLASSDVYFDLTAVVKEVFNFLSNQAT